MTYQLSYAGVPFMGDKALSARPKQVLKDIPVDLQQWSPECDLYREIDRILPFLYLQDVYHQPDTPNKSVSDLARRLWGGPFPDRTVRIGEYYYPTGMSRFSLFRGLASTSMVAKMLAATGGTKSKPFILQSTPLGGDDTDHLVTTNLYMLPPRIMGEHGGEYDGIFLVTLVDERYYFLAEKSAFTITRDTTWVNLIAQLSGDLGVSISYSTISPAYGQPEPDSQLWSSGAPLPVILDAVAFNLGRVVVRNLDGSYTLQTPMEAKKSVLASRGPVSELLRIAGGDVLQSGRSTALNAANAILPSQINVSFPQYILSDPIPHYHNPRYLNTRWAEDSYGGVYTVQVPLSSAGLTTLSGGWGIAMSGDGFTHHLADQAKAYYSGYAYFSSDPLNASGLTALAMQLAQDHCYAKVAANLDEVYPGTFAWTPEALHDIVWTYRETSRLASCRVLRRAWQDAINQFQHSLPPEAGLPTTPVGIGGKSVCQTHYDENLGPASNSITLAGILTSGATQASFAKVDYLPTKYRWKGQIDNEIILFEGTSGGPTGNVGIVQRGMDGTAIAQHDIGAGVSYVQTMMHGINAVKRGEGLFVYADTFTSGGVLGVKVPAQLLTVKVLSASGLLLNNTYHYSGLIDLYDPSLQPAPYTDKDYVWLIERNNGSVSSGAYYPGQFVGFSTTDAGVYPTSPIFLIDGKTAAGSSGNITGLTTELDNAAVVVHDTSLLALHAPAFNLGNPGQGVAQVFLNYGLNIQPVGLTNQPGNTGQPADAGHIHAMTLQVWNVANITNITPYDPVLVWNEYYQSLSWWDGTTWWCIPVVLCPSDCDTITVTNLAPCPPVVSTGSGWTAIDQGQNSVSLTLNWTTVKNSYGYAVISYYGGFSNYTGPSGWTLYERYDGSSQGYPTIEVWYRSLDGTETGAVTFNTGFATMGVLLAIKGGGIPEAYSTTLTPVGDATAASITTLGASRVLLAAFSEEVWSAAALQSGLTSLGSLSLDMSGLGAAGMIVGWQSVNSGATGSRKAFTDGVHTVGQLVAIPVTCIDVTTGVVAGSGAIVTSGSVSSGGASSGSSGPTVSVACCASPVPQTLFVTITGLTCLNGTYTIVYESSTGFWGFSPPLSKCGTSVGINLHCTGTAWVLNINCSSQLNTINTYTGTCSPMNLTFTPFSVTCGGFTGTVTATVTQ